MDNKESQTPPLHEWFMLIGCIGLCFAVAAIGSWLTAPALDDWYAMLRKPTWTPPNWIFGPVWSALYLSMAIAVWLVWRKRRSSAVTWPLTLFVTQLTLNLAWSGVFFGLRNISAALLEIVILWCAILATVVAFWRVTVTAGWLLAPYLGWVTFAVALNFSIWRLNN